jgi:exodeoxyribonuclease V alpha subunit
MTKMFSTGTSARLKVLTRSNAKLECYDTRLVTYDYGELDEVSLAYAISIHKSQGSEFPVVVIPLAMQQYMLLERNLVYTGITRGKKLVVLTGETKALRVAIRKNKTHGRHSGLLVRLQQFANIRPD